MTVTTKKVIALLIMPLFVVLFVGGWLLLDRSDGDTQKPSSLTTENTPKVPITRDLPSDSQPEGNAKRTVTAPAATTSTSPVGVTPFQRSLGEYNALVAELDANLAAYRASTPLFGTFSKVYVEEICPLVVKGVQAGVWLGEAQKRGMRLSNYDEQKVRKAYVAMVATICKDIYPDFHKAIETGQFSFSSKQGKIYFETWYAHFQISDRSVSRPFEQHYPYQDPNTYEYWYFTRQLMEAALTATVPLRKMVEQIPPELEEKQRKINELHAELVRQAKQSGETISLPAKYTEPYLKKFQQEEAKWSEPEDLHRAAQETLRRRMDRQSRPGSAPSR